MGDIANMMINGTLDVYTGEYIGNGPGYPRTLNMNKSDKYNYSPAERKVKKVRKELAILIKDKQDEFPHINKNKVVNTCRKYINLKYGIGWRERGYVINSPNRWKELNTYIAPEFNWELELNK